MGQLTMKFRQDTLWSGMALDSKLETSARAHVEVEPSCRIAELLAPECRVSLHLRLFEQG